MAQQLDAQGEEALDVPATLASRILVLATGRSNKNDPNDVSDAEGLLAKVKPESPAEKMRFDLVLELLNSTRTRFGIERSGSVKWTSVSRTDQAAAARMNLAAMA